MISLLVYAHDVSLLSENMNTTDLFKTSEKGDLKQKEMKICLFYVTRTGKET
jgi:hypothetical protein